MVTDPQPNVMGMPNPVAQPDATNKPGPVANAPQNTASANPAITQTDDQVQAKIKDMQAQANAQAPGGFIPSPAPQPAVSASPTAQKEVIDTSKTQPGVIAAGIKTNEPSVTNQQGTQPQQQQFQAITGNTNGGQASDIAWAASARTGKAQNLLTPQDIAEQQAISSRAMASQAGSVKEVMDGVVYDPATNTYKDPRTLNYFQGVTKTGTPLFSAVQETAIKGAFVNLESGIVTTDGYRQANEMIGNGLTLAKTNPITIPSANQIADPTGFASSSNDTLKFLNQQMSSSALSNQQGQQSEVVNILNGQATQIESMLKNPELDPKFASILQQQKALLEAKQNTITDIGSNFDNLTQEQTRSNTLALKHSMASINASGQVGSMVADSYLNSVIKSNEKSLRDIGVQRQKAVRDAELAYSQQDLQLSFEKLQRVQDLQDKHDSLQLQGAQMKEQYANNMFDRQMKMVTFSQQLEQYQNQKQDRAETKYTDSVAKWAMTGGVPDENQKLYFKQQDTKFGYPPGFSESLIKTQQKSIAAKSDADQISASKDIYSFLDQVPPGQAVTIGKNTYYGTQGTGKMEIDESGNGTLAYVDQKTGELKTKSFPKIGKADAGSFEPTWVNGQEGLFNKKTGTFTPYSTAPTATDHWSTLLPDGQKPPFGNGQCGNFYNQLTGGKLGHVGDSLESKVALTDPTLLANPALLQIGDAFVQSTGQAYGHIGFINNIENVNGRLQFTLTESNWHGDGTVSNSRKMFADDPALKGFIPSHGALPAAMTQEMTNDGQRQGPNFSSSQFGTQPSPIESVVSGTSPSSSGSTNTSFKIPNSPLANFSGSASQRQKIQSDESDAITAAKGLISNVNSVKDIPSNERVRAIEIASANGWKPPSSDANTSALGRDKDDKYITAAGKLADDYTNASKNFVLQRDGYQSAQGIDVNTTNPQDDISLVYSFMKVVDPTSVVRESEFNSAAKASSLLDQWNIKVGNVATGQILNPKVRQDIKDTMQTRFDAAQKNQDSIIKTYTQRAKGYKIDTADVITDYSEGLNQSQNQYDPAPPGQIMVKNMATGEIGYITEKEFDSKLYQRQ